jgi:hypothetical protein
MAPRKTISRWQVDPDCPPDYGDQDAGHLIDGQKTQWADDADPIVTEYADFLQMMRGNESDQHQAKKLWPAISMARNIAQHNDLRRWELEARILTGQSDEDIAARLGLPPEVVGMYEALFFSVRHCLDAYLYIAEQVIGPGRWQGFRNEEVGSLWAACGYFGGVAVLDALVAAFYAAWKPNQPVALSVYFQPGVDRDIQAFVAGSVLPISAPATLLMDFDMRLRNAGAAGDQARATAIREQVKAGVVRCARNQFAGKPVPKPKRRRLKPMTAHCGIDHPHPLLQALTHAEMS